MDEARRQLARHLLGTGIEVGPGHQPDAGLHLEGGEELTDAHDLRLDLSRAKAGGRVEEHAGLHPDPT